MDGDLDRGSARRYGVPATVGPAAARVPGAALAAGAALELGADESLGGHDVDLGGDGFGKGDMTEVEVSRGLQKARDFCEVWVLQAVDFLPELNGYSPERFKAWPGVHTHCIPGGQSSRHTGSVLHEGDSEPLQKTGE